MQINISFTDYFMEDDINKTLCYFKKDQLFLSIYCWYKNGLIFSKIFFQNSAKLFILNITNQNVLIVAVKWVLMVLESQNPINWKELGKNNMYVQNVIKTYLTSFRTFYKIDIPIIHMIFVKRGWIMIILLIYLMIRSANW